MNLPTGSKTLATVLQHSYTNPPCIRTMEGRNFFHANAFENIIAPTQTTPQSKSLPENQPAEDADDRSPEERVHNHQDHKDHA